MILAVIKSKIVLDRLTSMCTRRRDMAVARNSKVALVLLSVSVDVGSGGMVGWLACSLFRMRL